MEKDRRAEIKLPERRLDEGEFRFQVQSIDMVFAEQYSDMNDRKIATELVQKKLTDLTDRTHDAKLRNTLFRHLLTRGFEIETAEDVLNDFFDIEV